MILNEPETSLHPDLLPSPARPIVQASKQCQIIIVSHAATLVAALDAEADSHQIVLEKTLGETVQDYVPANWTWPSR
jgi:predicted ATPase